MTTLNSVTGPIDSKDLGFTLMHEHVMVSAPNMFRTFPDLFGPEDRVQRAIDTFKRAKEAGVDSIVDATTYDLGKDPQLLREVAEGS
ncbi:MAG: phosphotriesterase-related protein, partial [Gammaproteobacteria bacterium]|nr:phosphotriesterase-related protein [Gammaproteobacteria bacterium]